MEEYDGVPGESDQETSGKDVSNNDSYADHEDGDAAEQTGENDMQEETNGQCDVPPDPAMRGPFWGPHMRGPGPHGPHGPMGPGPGPHGGRGMWRGPPPPPRFRGRGPPGPPWPPRGGPWRGPAPPPFFRGPRPPFRGPPPPFDPSWGPPGSGGMMGPCPPGPRGGAPPGGGGGGGGGMRPPFAPPMSHPHHPHPHHPHHPPHHPHHPHPHQQHHPQQQQNQQQQAGLDLSTVWVETTTDQGKSYFYNAQSRQTSWTRPEGPDVRVLSQTEVEEMTRGSGEDGAADQGQFASQQQQHQQHQEQQHPHHHIPHHHHHPGVAGADASGESGYEHGEMPPGITAAAAAASVNGSDGSVVTPATAPTAAAAAGVHGGPFGYHMPPPSAGWPDPAAAAVNWAPPHQAGAGMDAAAWTGQQSQHAGVAATAAGAAASATQPVIQSAPALDNKQLDPQLVARAAEWTEHSAPDGRKYYYNASTQQSVWNKPQPMIELEAARLAAQQQVAAVAAAAVAAGTVPDTVPGMTSEQLSTASSAASVAGVSSLAGSVNNTVVDGDRRTDGAVDGDGMDVDDEDGVPAAAASAAVTDGDKSAQQEDLSSSSATTTATAQAEAEQQRKKKEEEERAAAAAAAAKKQQDKSRPVSSTPVPGSPWCVVWTGDRRVFFFNPSTRTSVWQRPADLTGRADVDKMLVPASSAASDDDDNNAVDSGNQTASATSQQSGDGGGGGDPSASATATTSSSSSVAVVEGQQEREAASTAAVLSDQPPPAKKTKLDDSTVDSGDDGPKKIDIGKEAAIEAEARAARERAVVPLDTRMKQFRDMLVEKEVSAFSTWEKELHKIVFDARYLLLTSRERRQVFDKYTKERAEEERREKRSRMRENRDHFKQLLQDLGVTVKSSFSDFAQKHSKEERFRAVDKMRDRESLFNEYIQDLRRKEKEDRFARREQVKRDFFALLSEQSWLDRHARWSDVRRRLDEEARFRAVESSGQREDWFRDHLHDLKERRRRDKRQRDKKRSGGGGGGGERRRASCSATRDNNDDDVDSGASSGEVSRAENGGAGNEGGNGQGEAAGAGAGGGSPMNEAHSTAGSLKEEGERSDEDSDHGDEEVRRAEREKKERAEASIREREKEVQRTLAEHLRDRDKERQQHKHDEAVQNMNAVLADLVRSADASWREARKLLKKDQRWSLCQSLDKPQREKLFLAHVDALNKKKTDKLRELLDEQNIAFGSTWKEAKKLIRDDPRYSKVTFGDKQRNERAFRDYLKDKATAARAEFRQLLAETKCITHESLHRVADNQQHMKDILDVLRQDNRYIRLEPLAEEREQLIVSYLEELEQRGPPPPPTASEPCRRSAK